MASTSEPITSLFITGLRNAHAVEKQALSIMTPQVSRIEHYPEMADRLRQHIEETNGQIDRLDELLASFDTSGSALKDAALSFTGAMAALGHTPAGDEILKNSFANYAFEHFEIASYKSLLTLAEVGGFSAATAPLSSRFGEEQDMGRVDRPGAAARHPPLRRTLRRRGRGNRQGLNAPANRTAARVPENAAGARVATCANVQSHPKPGYARGHDRYAPDLDHALPTISLFRRRRPRLDPDRTQ